MGHHHELPLTRVMELRPNQQRHHPKISPRALRNYVPTNRVIFIMHINLMPTFITIPHSYSMLNPYHLILPKSWIYKCISYQHHATLITNHLFVLHTKITLTHQSNSYPQIFYAFHKPNTLNQSIKQSITTK